MEPSEGQLVRETRASVSGRAPGEKQVKRWPKNHIALSCSRRNHDSQRELRAMRCRSSSLVHLSVALWYGGTEGTGSMQALEGVQRSLTGCCFRTHRHGRDARAANTTERDGQALVRLTRCELCTCIMCSMTRAQTWKLCFKNDCIAE
eukprot:scaffold416_cov329-Pavlova_lutheri.AAC.27